MHPPIIVKYVVQYTELVVICVLRNILAKLGVVHGIDYQSITIMQTIQPQNLIKKRFLLSTTHLNMVDRNLMSCEILFFENNTLRRKQ